MTFGSYDRVSGAYNSLTCLVDRDGQTVEAIPEEPDALAPENSLSTPAQISLDL